MTASIEQPKSAPSMDASGVLPALITVAFPTHDMSGLYPCPPPEGTDLISRAIKIFDDVGMGFDLIDFALSVGLMPLSRGLLRLATGQGKPNFGLHILYLPWTALSTAANEHTLRRYHVQVRHVCANSHGYWLAVGSLQATWAVEILTRTMTGRQPRLWADQRSTLNVTR